MTQAGMVEVWAWVMRTVGAKEKEAETLSVLMWPMFIMALLEPALAFTAEAEHSVATTDPLKCKRMQSLSMPAA
eukprot:349921-Alexandrium_andersonii.AAC.1